MTPADQQNLLNRCSPGYRAAVTGRRELPARKTRCGAVQFACYGLSDRREGDYTILRATIDEGQVVELKLPKGVGVAFTDLSPMRGPKPPAVDSGADTAPAGKGAAL